jgi:DNA gyrase subunit A
MRAGVPETEGQRFIVMGTQKGTIKKTDLALFSNQGRGIIALQVDETTPDCRRRNGRQNLVIGTRNGMAIRFSEDDARPMGGAYGVRGIQLREATRSSR